MALNKSTEEDKIEIVGNHKFVVIRTATVITEDGNELSRSFERRTLAPCVKSDGAWSDTDISSESTAVQGICNAVWSDEIKTAYKAFWDANE